jgi:HEAT repeat protein
MTSYPSIELLKAVQDLDSLVSALRSPHSARLRAAASQALGEMGDIRAVESLLRSALEDPDDTVQAASHAALIQLLGNTAEMAIASYSSNPTDADPWLNPALAGDLLDGTRYAAGQGASEGAEGVMLPGGMPAWNLDHADGLMALLKSNAPEEIRLRAIQALKSVPDARRVDTFARIALWGEGEKVQQAAREALEDLVGDHLEQVLQSYQQIGADQIDDGSLYLYLDHPTETGKRYNKIPKDDQRP